MVQLALFVFQQFGRFEILSSQALEHGTKHWHRFKLNAKCDFFSIYIILVVKKSNLVVEPHGFPQGYTMGGGGINERTYDQTTKKNPHLVGK